MADDNSYNIAGGGAVLLDATFTKEAGGAGRVLSLIDEFTVNSNLTVKNETASAYYIYGNGTITPAVVNVIENLNFPMSAQAGQVYFGGDTATDKFTVNNYGNFALSDANVTIYSPINFVGSMDKTITHTAGDIYGTITINEPYEFLPPMLLSARVELATALSTYGDVVITQGALYTSGKDLTIAGTLYNNDRLMVKGSESFFYSRKRLRLRYRRICRRWLCRKL